jgi:hypothetical protein
MIKRTTRRCEHHLMLPDQMWGIRVEGRECSDRTWVLINRTNDPCNPALHPNYSQPCPPMIPSSPYPRTARKEEGEGGEGRKAGKRRGRMKVNVRFFINPEPPVKASPAARIELTLGMYILLYLYVLYVDDGSDSSDSNE